MSTNFSFVNLKKIQINHKNFVHKSFFNFPQKVKKEFLRSSNSNKFLLPTFVVPPFKFVKNSKVFNFNLQKPFKFERFILNRLRFLTLISRFHKNGKRLRSEKFILFLLLLLKCKMKRCFIFGILNFIFDFLEPMFFLKKFKKSGKTLLLPAPAAPKRRAKLALDFIFSSILKPNSKSSVIFNLVVELISILKKKKKICFVVKKKKI